MIVRYFSLFTMSLLLTSTGLGEEPEVLKLPENLTQPVLARSQNLSALEHLRLATEKLEAAGMTEEAAKLREVSNLLSQRVQKDQAEITRKIAELQKQSKQLRLLTGEPDKILCRCCILELSDAAFAEFEAEAEEVIDSKDSHNEKNSKASFYKNAIYQNAEETIRKLKKTGKVSLIHASPEIITTPGQPAVAKVGGEFPIMVVPVSGQQKRVEWRQFGIQCRVVPHLLESGRIQLQFQPEMSHRDFKNAVKINDITIPGLTTRRFQTRMEMNLGETLVVSMKSNPASHIQVVNAESGTGPSEKGVTLFMVTPVAAD